MNKVIKTVSLGLLLSTPFMYGMEEKALVERTPFRPRLLGMPDEIGECLKSLMRLNDAIREVLANFSMQELYNRFFMAVHNGDIDVNAQNDNGETALICAMKDVKTFQQAIVQQPIVDQLIKAGATIDASSNNGMTALMWAVLRGLPDAIELLIQQGANVNLQDNDNWTALMFASQDGRTKAVQVLLQNEAELDLQNNNGETALICAMKDVETFQQAMTQQAIVEQLIKAGATIDASSNNGMTALVSAALSGLLGAIELLIQHGANVNLQDNDGWTALMFASQDGQTKAVQVLLQHGARRNLQNNYGETAFDIAIAEGGRAEIINLLREAGAQN